MYHHKGTFLPRKNYSTKQSECQLLNKYYECFECKINMIIGDRCILVPFDCLLYFLLPYFIEMKYQQTQVKRAPTNSCFLRLSAFRYWTLSKWKLTGCPFPAFIWTQYLFLIRKTIKKNGPLSVVTRNWCKARVRTTRQPNKKADVLFFKRRADTKD